MASRASFIDSRLAALDEALLAVRAGGALGDAINRWRAAAGAMRFHLRERGKRPPAVVILGGTGTGKSTIVNRLAEADLTAASFRRTFTAGPIAIAARAANVPSDFLAVPHEPAAALPARGRADVLIVVESPADVAQQATLVDTPDLDGDQPAHHAQADRAFRWAEALVFVVTPEKYQMTELLGYYRLAQRYAVPALFVMNKTEQREAVEDYARQLETHGYEAPRVFAVPRDDSSFQAEPDRDLGALRQALGNYSTDPAQRVEGLKNRGADLLDRLHDQVINPLEQDRREADRVIGALRAMEAPQAGIDVNPLTRQLARRLQQKSILYLMGPQRILDRVRQVPSLMVRLPRTAWDWMRTGKADLSALGDLDGGDGRKVPDFNAMLRDQFAVLQTRIDDALRASEPGTRWIAEDAESHQRAKLSPDRAGAIADEELADLRQWLEKRWNATPRDTALLMKVIKHLPGGEQLSKWSEAAPYLLTIIVATHHAFFGHIDLMILGGYTLATWLTERMSNEVAARTRLTNRRIAERFERLAHEQIDATIKWIESRVPSRSAIDRIRQLGESLATE